MKHRGKGKRRQFKVDKATLAALEEIAANLPAQVELKGNGGVYVSCHRLAAAKATAKELFIFQRSQFVQKPNVKEYR